MADAGAEGADERLVGELTLAPSGIVPTLLFIVSGIAALRAGAALVGRAAFAYRKPAAVRLSARGLEISHRVELLGRTLRERETLIPLSNLASVTREVAYARLGLYAGLAALCIGTYVGTGLLVDGLRVPGFSASLIGMGVAAVALGVVLDFVLSVALDAAKKTCRLVVVPRTGKKLCIGGLDRAATDEVLEKLKGAVLGGS